MARPEHKPIKKILCPECKASDTFRISLPKNQGGHTITVVAHRSTCKSPEIQYCCQDIQSGSGYYSYYSNKCGKAVKGFFKGGTYQWTKGVPACGLHLAHERKLIKKDEEADSAREIRSYLEDMMQEKVAHVIKETGIPAQVHRRTGYTSQGYRTFIDGEWILVKVDDLIAAIQVEIEEGEA